MAENCGVFTSDGFEGSGTGWICGRPQGHPHDGARYGKVTAGNHARTPLPQDESEPFGPSREGSPHCQSGSLASGGTKTYCTCDTCF